MQRRKHIINSDIILLHIPKTAGTTIKILLFDHQCNFTEVHMNRYMESLTSEYLDYLLINLHKKVIITWRDPLDHVLSSFYFYQQYPSFNASKNLEEFIDNPTFMNMQTGFMTHKKFLQWDKINQDHYNSIKPFINRPNTFWFLADYSNSLYEPFKDFIGLKTDKKFTRSRFNFNKPANELLISG